ncbi:MAG: hypothetical protein ABIA78_01465 [archaeon]
MDIFVEIDYHVNPRVPLIRTNLKEKKIDDFLSDYLRAQIDQGMDYRSRNEKEVYNIWIRCDLNSDTFYVSSDTGNKDLTAGIVMGSLGNWWLRDKLLPMVIE